MKSVRVTEELMKLNRFPQCAPGTDVTIENTRGTNATIPGKRVSRISTQQSIGRKAQDVQDLNVAIERKRNLKVPITTTQQIITSRGIERKRSLKVRQMPA